MVSAKLIDEGLGLLRLTETWLGLVVVVGHGWCELRRRDACEEAILTWSGSGSGRVCKCLKESLVLAAWWSRAPIW